MGKVDRSERENAVKTLLATLEVLWDENMDSCNGPQAIQVTLMRHFWECTATRSVGHGYDIHLEAVC